MVDANESAVALDMVSEVLAERQAAVSDENAREVAELAALVGLGDEVAARLGR